MKFKSVRPAANLRHRANQSPALVNWRRKAVNLIHRFS